MNDVSCGPQRSPRFQLSRRSLDRLEGVHPDLVKVVELAIQFTPVDFTVLEGLRLEARQRELVESGASTTMNSRHLTGHAVDLGAYVGGEVRWDWPLYYRIADAMKTAGQHLGVRLVWGGVWDRELTQLNMSAADASEAYVLRRREAGKTAFVDGPHFQLPWEEYPA